jgi:hypothetical protein
MSQPNLGHMSQPNHGHMSHNSSPPKPSNTKIAPLFISHYVARKLKWISAPSPTVVTSSTQENTHTDINYGNYRSIIIVIIIVVSNNFTRFQVVTIDPDLDLDKQDEIRRRQQLHGIS